MTTLIGRRWATTPIGGGVQKAGVENTAGFIGVLAVQFPTP
jgi:hypothetical protein